MISDFGPPPAHHARSLTCIEAAEGTRAAILLQRPDLAGQVHIESVRIPRHAQPHAVVQIGEGPTAKVYDNLHTYVTTHGQLVREGYVWLMRVTD